PVAPRRSVRTVAVRSSGALRSDTILRRLPRRLAHRQSEVEPEGDQELALRDRRGFRLDLDVGIDPVEDRAHLEPDQELSTVREECRGAVLRHAATPPKPPTVRQLENPGDEERACSDFSGIGTSDVDRRAETEGAHHALPFDGE